MIKGEILPLNQLPHCHDVNVIVKVCMSMHVVCISVCACFSLHYARGCKVPEGEYVYVGGEES